MIGPSILENNRARLCHRYAQINEIVSTTARFVIYLSFVHIPRLIPKYRIKM